MACLLRSCLIEVTWSYPSPCCCFKPAYMYIPFLKYTNHSSTSIYSWRFRPKLSTNQWPARVFPGKKISRRQTTVRCDWCSIYSNYVLFGPSKNMVKNGKGIYVGLKQLRGGREHCVTSAHAATKETKGLMASVLHFWIKWSKFEPHVHSHSTLFHLELYSS